jgi:DNA-binding response OmpR family regulator
LFSVLCNNSTEEGQFVMPFHDCPVEDKARDAVVALRSGGSESSRPRLLLVDDEPLVGRMLGHAAQECGYEAAVAGSLAAFRREYDAKEPEVVLLDLSLKGGDGIELMRFLAERNSRALILIVSGFEQRVIEAAERLGRALGLRIGGCLAKPIFVKELGDAIAAGKRAVAEEREDGHACL